MNETYPDPSTLDRTVPHDVPTETRKMLDPTEKTPKGSAALSKVHDTFETVVKPKAKPKSK